jgi:hypothetical protein
MEGYYYRFDENCCDTCIGCLIGECDHTYNLEMDIERNKDKFNKVIEELNWKTKKLKIYINTIKKNIPYVDIKPYSHNIINLTLTSIGEQFGNNVANKIIADTELKNMGWGCWLN